MERRRVVITGLGAVTPIGLTAGESWQAVKNGVCGIGPITHYDPAAQKVKLAAEVKGFDPEALLGRQESKRMGRFTQFAVAAAREALSDAGFSVEQADPDRCGVILSSGIGGQAITESEHSRGLEKGFDRVSPFYVPTAICNMAAGQVAIDAGFRAMCSCPVTACAGGTNAVGDAFHYIRDGYAEVMLCGGTEASITPMSIGGFTSMKALTQTEDPKRASIPFDAERSGSKEQAMELFDTAASSWARAQACCFWRNWNTPRPAGRRSTPRWWATALPATLTTSPPLLRTAAAAPRPWPWR